MEITFVNFAFSFDTDFGITGLQTIWSIGISMVILGLFIWLPFPAVLITGLLIVLCHNTLDPFEATRFRQPISITYDLLHRVNFHHLWGNHNLLILYPFLPWTGLMMVGYGFGKLFTSYEGEKRKRILTWLGFGVIAYFIALRISNAYGDANHWSQQKNLLYSALSFINTVKYPPSLLYSLMTLGPCLVFLSIMEKPLGSWAQPFLHFGRVPMFFYILHIYLIHLMATIALVLTGGDWHDAIIIDGFRSFHPPGFGFSLGVVYLVWITAILILYPFCKWYDGYKMSHKDKWWLSYL